MSLALSSAAAPELTLHALDAACRARGLEGEELVIADGENPEAAAASAIAAGARIVALRAEVVSGHSVHALARASGKLGAPVSVPSRAAAHLSLPWLALIFESAGGRLLIGHRTDLKEALALVHTLRRLDAPQSLGLAWEIQPGRENLDDAGAVLLAVQDYLGVVRLYGGGPEQREQDGLGIGPLFVDLALSGYTGPIILRPSGDHELPRWHKWLRSRGSSGCGHRVDALTTVLDMRDVEPKHRLETILGAYHSLERGAVLQLTVDHDPSCMYYTLEASEPAGSFAFRITEHGPEVWRAEVKKL